MNYFVSGAVDIVDPNTSHKDAVPEGSLVYHWGRILGLGGFMTIEANELAMTVEFHQAIDKGMTVLYKTDPISPRKF